MRDNSREIPKIKNTPTTVKLLESGDVGILGFFRIKKEKEKRMIRMSACDCDDECSSTWDAYNCAIA